MVYKGIRIFSYLSFALQFLLEGLLWKTIHDLGMLPGKYMTIINAALFGLLVVTGLLVYPRKEEEDAKLRRVLASLFAVVISLGSVAAYRTLSLLNITLSSVTATTTEKSDRIGIYVLQEDTVENVQEIGDYAIGYVNNYDGLNTAQTLEYIDETCGKQVTRVVYRDLLMMVDALYNKEIQAFVLNCGYITLIDEQSGYHDFEEKTRVLYEYVPHSRNLEQTAAPVKEKVTRTEVAPFIVYCSGSDTRSVNLDVGRSDVNILAVVNPENRQILLINTPRDTFLPISISESGEKDKLTHCGLYGVQCSMDTLSAFYGINIDAYAQINFAGFEKLIDALGGITVHSDYAFTVDKVTINEGANFLNGKQALRFARERHSLPGGDNDRGKNQMEVLQAVIQKLSTGTFILRYEEILASLQGMFKTSMTSTEISNLIKREMEEKQKWSIFSFALTGEGGNSSTFSMPYTTSYVMYPNEDSMAYCKELMQKVLDGERLTKNDMTMPQKEAPETPESDTGENNE